MPWIIKLPQKRAYIAEGKPPFAQETKNLSLFLSECRANIFSCAHFEVDARAARLIKDEINFGVK